MAKFIPALALSALLLQSLPAAAVDHKRYGPIFPVVEQISRDVRLVHLTPEVAIEQIRGASAIAHLNKLIARNPAAFVKSRQKWLQRGYKPTDEVFVERTVRTAKRATNSSDGDLRLTQTSQESNADDHPWNFQEMTWSGDGGGSGYGGPDNPGNA